MRRAVAVALVVAFAFAALVAQPTSGSAASSNDQYVRIVTTQGTIDLELFTDVTPNTVANFMKLIDSYASTTFFDRSTTVASDGVSVLQGGMYYVNGSDQVSTRTGDAQVAHEAGPSNTRGTIAMTRQTNDVNSATSEFFFNVQDNTSLDTANGGYTVFGKVANAASLAVMDKIAGLPTADLSGSLGPTFNRVPVQDYNGSPTTANLVKMSSFKKVTAADVSPSPSPTPVVTAAPPSPTPSPTSTATPTATPSPFRVTKSDVKVAPLKRGTPKTTIKLRGLPSAARVAGTLKLGKLVLRDKATASASGTAKLTFRLSRRARKALKHRAKVTATIKVMPPGGTPSSVSITQKVV